MIPESLCNRVYFSALLPEVCPVTYKGLADVLDRYGVPFSLLKGTKDIWCRDYMPLQITDHEYRLPSVRCQTGKHQIFIVIVEHFRYFRRFANKTA